mgnify:CR=1 FL=1
MAGPETMLIVLCRSGGVLLVEDPDAGELAESDTNEPVIVIEPALVGWFPLAVSSPPPAQTMPAAAKQHTKTRDLYAAPVFPRLTALHEPRISERRVTITVYEERP